ncbi:flavodoxin-dependent (E)-4-hydroxy-3-methylbut-2-enyl-diphosphate synthase [Natranaerofaba carboxydovora]|uniref:flavodoxin-dependent (E)-4-hydroxy-3-methylbut-2-enyl-diphosphate synthase n=1 Tax=Natranaerofaba carboxydovora TaxID=2742683 RepID=UPI001F131282|nr:flavodoxin-dependent (E)-4-hydroxy-3-methylbut-2-enyl-diphosphate synthase [Natranaerofaba carboxydovora]UMZ73403.1 4-hydroxy-3-methylbut-2-en-1-yl diphosphate synthase (flavodoxin) [Natranaerofaba carboxydovora]
MRKHNTFQIDVGGVKIGGNNPVSIQSMTNTSTSDPKKTLEQIDKLYEVGCEIVRVALPVKEDVKSFGQIVEKSPIPVIADIHFDYTLAIEAISVGAAKIRINPGNIGTIDKLEKVINKAISLDTPIRVGINSGSLEKELLKKYGGPTHEALVESAVKNVNLIKEIGHDKVVVSLKASDVLTTINAYREFAKQLNNPLHLGVTEAGTFLKGSIKNAIGIGSLLADGIGDTLRVSLTGSPVDEIKVGIYILQSLGLKSGINVISCPTCSRTAIDVEELAKMVEQKLLGIKKDLTIAVMGCSVNGPGEAREADIGVAGGKNKALIFKNGEVIKTVQKGDLINELIKELKQ